MPVAGLEDGERSPSQDRRVAADTARLSEDLVAKGIAQGISKYMAQLAKKNKRCDPDSDSDAEETDVCALLRKYHMGTCDVLEMPDSRLVQKQLSQAEKQSASGRMPFVDVDLGKSLGAVRDRDCDWLKSVDAASMSMAQFSSLWWRRAMLQLVCQGKVEKETRSMGDLINRWLVLSRIACDESVKAAILYDRATWKEAASRINMRDRQFDPSTLGKLQQDPLSVVLREKERASTQHVFQRGRSASVARRSRSPLRRPTGPPQGLQGGREKRFGNEKGRGRGAPQASGSSQHQWRR